MKRPNRRRARWFFGVAVAAGALAACSASNPSEFGDEPEQPVSTSAATSSGATTGVGGSFEADGGACPTECSADLRDIVDCNGKVLGTCPSNQACAAGACVVPCDAAKLSKSSIGCEYQVANPDVTFSAGACYAVFLANTWPEPVKITVSRDGQALDTQAFARIPSGSGQSMTYAPLPNGELPPNEIAVLFLAQFGPEKLYTPACPAGVTPAISTEDAALHGTGYGKAFQISTSAPVVAYDIFPYGGGKSAITSATLLLPASVWDKNYVAVAPYRKTVPGDPNFESWIQILASEDDTSVTISPTAPILGGGGVAPTPQGVPVTYTLQKGEVLQITQDDELSGSPILADKPIALVGGNRCMNMPEAAAACDAGHQAIPPVKALGHEYVAVRYRNRVDGLEEAPPWRMVGAVDGTTLTYDPPMPGAPKALAAGEVAEFRVAGPFQVQSQDADHPFYMSAHMTGCTEISFTDSCLGDPESVNVLPPEQYLDSYVFFTDPTYPETNLVLIRAKGANGFEDVDLDCAGVVTGWKPIGAGDYEYTRIDLTRHDFAPQNGCDNGRHEISSKAPFGLTVWGWGSAETGGGLEYPPVTPGFYTQCVSYAYPAGASVQAITDVEVPPTPR